MTETKPENIQTPRLDVFGWFDSPEQTKPAHDPGPTGLCPVCCWPIGKHGAYNEVQTISVALQDLKNRTRSYFFRVHKNCWGRTTPHNRMLIESSVIDMGDRACSTCRGTKQIQTTEWPALYDSCPD